MSQIVMSRFMRDLLIEHIDGPIRHNVPLTKILGYTDPRERHRRRLSFLRCLDRGWLALDDKVNPTCTVLTDKGKQDLCAVLAEWADCLVRAGLAREHLSAAFERNLEEAWRPSIHTKR